MKMVDEENNVGDAVIDRKTEKDRIYTIDDGGGENPGILGRSGVLEHIAAILDDDYILEDGKSLQITIRRHDMTHEEIEAVPEV